MIKQFIERRALPRGLRLPCSTTSWVIIILTWRVTIRANDAGLYNGDACGVHLCCMMPVDETHDDHQRRLLCNLRPYNLRCASSEIRRQRSSRTSIGGQDRPSYVCATPSCYTCPSCHLSVTESPFPAQPLKFNPVFISYVIHPRPTPFKKALSHRA